MADTTTEKYCVNCACPLLQPAEDSGGTRTVRVEELLRQNHPPFDVELPAFRKIAEDTRTALEDLDLKIVVALQLLNNLLSARQQAQSRLEDAKSILHPMRSIPNELLVTIFGHCISETANDEDPDSLDPQAAPWLLTRVCHRWRELAIDSPQLWTHLFLDFDRQMDHITDLQCAYKVGVFTDRSRGRPMTVYLGSEESIKGRPVLPILEVSIPRWKYLEVDLPRTSLQCLSGNHFSNLRELWLGNSYSYEWDISVDVFNSTSTPILRNLEVALLPDQSWRALKHVMLPWSRLTCITSFPAFDADGLNYLRTLVNLEDLQVDVIGSDEHKPIRDIIPLPKLRFLTTIESRNASGRTKEFFSALAIPALSELTLAYHATSVTQFPTSPPPLGNLTKLEVSCKMKSHKNNAQNFLNFLTLAHRIEWLSIVDRRMTLEFVEGLSLDKLVNGSSVRLPCLRFLDIGECGFASTLYNDIDQLFEMLYSRLPVVTVKGKEEAEDNANAGMDGNGRSAVTNETGTEFESRPRDHGRCLKTVRFPRWLYVKTRREWPDRFHELTSRVELECGVTTKDIDF